MSERVNEDADRQFDRELLSWRDTLNADASQLQRMQRALQSRMEVQPLTEGEAASPRRSSRWAVLTTVACVMLVGVALLQFSEVWNPFSQRIAGNGPTEHADPIASDRLLETAPEVAFTPSDIRRKSLLVCELDRLFEHQLIGVHQRDSAVSVDVANQDLATAEVPRLILRFVLQQQFGTGEWSTIRQEEVIGQLDHQFDLHPAASQDSVTNSPTIIDVRYWSHLLPDESLWMESTITQLNGTAVHHSKRYQLNRPTSVWEQTVDGIQWRMLVVYELLNPCQQGVT